MKVQTFFPVVVAVAAICSVAQSQMTPSRIGLGSSSDDENSSSNRNNENVLGNDENNNNVDSERTVNVDNEGAIFSPGARRLRHSPAFHGMPPLFVERRRPRLHREEAILGIPGFTFSENLQLSHTELNAMLEESLTPGLDTDDTMTDSDTTVIYRALTSDMTREAWDDNSAGVNTFVPLPVIDLNVQRNLQPTEPDTPPFEPADEHDRAPNTPFPNEDNNLLFRTPPRQIIQEGMIVRTPPRLGHRRPQSPSRSPPNRVTRRRVSPSSGRVRSFGLSAAVYDSRPPSRDGPTFLPPPPTSYDSDNSDPFRSNDGYARQLLPAFTPGNMNLGSIPDLAPPMQRSANRVFDQGMPERSEAFNFRHRRVGGVYEVGIQEKCLSNVNDALTKLYDLTKSSKIHTNVPGYDHALKQFLACTEEANMSMSDKKTLIYTFLEEKEPAGVVIKYFATPVVQVPYRLYAGSYSYGLLGLQYSPHFYEPAVDGNMTSAVLSVPLDEPERRNRQMAFINNHGNYILGFYAINSSRVVDDIEYELESFYLLKDTSFGGITVSEAFQVAQKLTDVVKHLWDNGADFATEPDLCITVASYKALGEDTLFDIKAINSAACLESALVHVPFTPVSARNILSYLNVILNSVLLSEDDDSNVFSSLPRSFGLSNFSDLVREVSTAEMEEDVYKKMYTIYSSVWARLDAASKGKTFVSEWERNGFVAPGNRTIGLMNSILGDFPSSVVTRHLHLDLLHAGFVVKDDVVTDPVTDTPLDPISVPVVALDSVKRLVDLHSLDYTGTSLIRPTAVMKLTDDNSILHVNYPYVQESSNRIKGFGGVEGVKSFKAMASDLLWMTKKNLFHSLSTGVDYHIPRKADGQFFIPLNPSTIGAIENPSSDTGIVRESTQMVLSTIMVHLLRLRGYNMAYSNMSMSDVRHSLSRSFKNTISYQLLTKVAPSREEADFINFLYFDGSRNYDSILEDFNNHPFWDALTREIEESGETPICRTDREPANWDEGASEKQKYLAFCDMENIYAYPSIEYDKSELKHFFSLELNDAEYATALIGILHRMNKDGVLNIARISLSSDISSQHLDVFHGSDHAEFPGPIAYAEKMIEARALYAKYGLDYVAFPNVHADPKSVPGLLAIKGYVFHHKPVFPSKVIRIALSSFVFIEKYARDIGTGFVFNINYDALEKASYLMGLSNLRMELGPAAFYGTFNGEKISSLLSNSVIFSDLIKFVKGEKTIEDHELHELYADAQYELSSYLLLGDTVPIVAYEDAQSKSQETTACPICFTDFDADTSIIDPACCHPTCESCAKQWATGGKDTCVMCRRRLPIRFVRQ